MKIKNGFITNSSSCSFIITITTRQKRTLEQFKKMFNNFLDIYKSSYYNNEQVKNMQFWNPNMIIKKPGSETETEFEIHEYTGMYNDYGDIPHYIRHLLLMSITDREALEDILNLEELTFKEDRD